MWSMNSKSVDVWMGAAESAVEVNANERPGYWRRYTCRAESQ